MKTVLEKVFSLGLGGFLAALMLSAIVWVVGPLLPIGGPTRFFDPWTTRAAFAGVFFAIWLLALGIRWLRRRRSNDQLLDALSPEESDVAGRKEAETDALRRSFTEAMGQLRRMRFRSRFGGQRMVYELPWYVFVGPPASGKTTALKNCGLNFPLQRGEEIALAGVQGTRDCDWMFADEAVFLDTAGRYTTQDGDREVERAGWLAFLDLLARTRPAEPINGVIVAISLEELARGEGGRIDRHAAAVRRALTELSEKLSADIPVYVMFTKADLLRGFTELFRGMEREEREQVWGITFPWDAAPDAAGRVTAALESFPEDFAALQDRLGAAALKRIQEEADLGVRADIFGFLGQFASLRPELERFLREAFQPDRYSRPLSLRGVYVTSATQEGQPIDRLITSMSREFGLSRPATAIGARGGGRAYFLTGLLNDVVFPEAGLVGGGKRRAGLGLKVASIVAMLAIPAALGGAWLTSAAAMRGEADTLTAAIAEHETRALAFDRALVSDVRAEDTLPALDVLAVERARLATAEPPLPVSGLGVTDYDTLRAQADIAYAKALDSLFRPRLQYAFEQRLDALLDEPRALYDALKAYLMLVGEGPLDAGFLRRQIELHWSERFDAVLERDVLAGLGVHLDGMLEAMETDRLAPRPRNDRLVARARVAARDVTMAERAYGLLLSRADAVAPRGFSIRDLPDGLAAEGVLLRASGLDLFEPVPGLFTLEGYVRAVEPRIDAAVEDALAEKWVLGEEREGGALGLGVSDEQVRARSRVRDLYQRDYIDAWAGFLTDLRAAPLTTPQTASEVLRVLSSRGSPLRGVLLEAARQTDPAAVFGAEAGGDAAGQAATAGRIAGQAGAAGARVGTALNRAGGLVGGGGAEALPEGAGVSRAFRPLREFVTADDPGGGGLEALIVDLGELRRTLSDMIDRRSTDMAALLSAPAARRIEEQALTGPPEIRALLQEMLRTYTETLTGDMMSELDGVYRRDVVPVCRRMTSAYPFSAGPDLPFGDLEAVLGPEGAIARFVERRLDALVDRSTDPWRLTGEGLKLDISADRLAFFQTAAELTQAFYGSSDVPRVTFGAIADAWSPGTARLTLEVGGSPPAVFEAGARTQAQLAWPGLVPVAGATAELTVVEYREDVVTGRQVEVTRPVQTHQAGDWGLFRLMDRFGARPQRGGASMAMAVSAGGGAVVVTLGFDRQRNALAMRDQLRRFRCPDRL